MLDGRHGSTLDDVQIRRPKSEDLFVLCVGGPRTVVFVKPRWVACLHMPGRFCASILVRRVFLERLHWSPWRRRSRFILSKLSKTVSVPPVFPVSPMVPQFNLMSPSVVVSLGNAASHYHGRFGCGRHDASQPHMFHSGRRICTGVHSSQCEGFIGNSP